MATEVSILGRIRGALRDIYATGDQRIALADGGELLTANALPWLTELVRQGNSVGVLSAATAALVAVPTTTAGHSLWNGDTQKSYAIDSFGCVEIITDATQENSLAMFAMNNIAPALASAPADAGLTRAVLGGKRYSGNARTIAAQAVTNDGWQPHGPTVGPGGSAFAGDVWRITEVDVAGLYLVRPLGMFNIAAVKTVATASQIQYFIRWHEVLVTLP